MTLPQRLLSVLDQRTRPAWAVFRALDELAGPQWVWRGLASELAERARVTTQQLPALLLSLSNEQAILCAHPSGSTPNIRLETAARLELQGLLKVVCPGVRPLVSTTPCAIAGPVRARCELEIGHTGHHVDGGHPALRRGEILRWDSRGSLC